MAERTNVRRVRRTWCWVTRDADSNVVEVWASRIRPREQLHGWWDPGDPENEASIVICARMFSRATGLVIPAGSCLRVRFYAEPVADSAAKLVRAVGPEVTMTRMEQLARVVDGHPVPYSLALDRDVRPAIARRVAQAWLDRHKPGAQVEHVAGRYVFYGWPVAGHWRPLGEAEQPEVWHDDDVELHDDGTATIHTATNDNDDDGWPDPAGTESWSTRWRSWESALRHVGKSRVGMTGIRVTVRVNGREYTGRWPEDRRDWPLDVNACARCGGAIRAGDEFVYELAPPLAVAHQGCAGSSTAGPLAKARSD